jgi:hypothetical protein
MGYKAKDLTGLKVGLLTVLAKDSTYKPNHLKWLCQCACKSTTVVDAGSLCRKRRATQSCGCFNRQRSRESATHAMSKTPPYLVWRNFQSRCENPKNPKFKDYGGRGISVCGRWANSFEDFWEDMKAEYKLGLYLDRTDNNGNYEPGNCRWVTPRVSTENRRNAILVTFEGELMNLSEAARRSGVEYSVARQRFKKGVPESELFSLGREGLI